MRDDLAGPATCYAFRRGLATEEVLGVCRADVDSRQLDATSRADAADAADAVLADASTGTCNRPPVTLPQCTESPANDSGTGSDADGDADADALEGSAGEGGEDDARAADAADADAATDANDGGDQ